MSETTDSVPGEAPPEQIVPVQEALHPAPEPLKIIGFARTEPLHKPDLIAAAEKEGQA